MHASSMHHMTAFVREHLLESYKGQPLDVLDVGSMNPSGGYRALFDPPWSYKGLDIENGPNVDIVEPMGKWSLDSGTFDVVISGQAFEHISHPWVVVREVARVLRPGGLFCMIVPSAGPEHRYPLDCWRFYPDGLRVLARWADLEVISAVTHWEDGPWEDESMSNQWHDSILVARKAVPDA